MARGTEREERRPRADPAKCGREPPPGALRSLGTHARREWEAPKLRRPPCGPDTAELEPRARARQHIQRGRRTGARTREASEASSCMSLLDEHVARVGERSFGRAPGRAPEEDFRPGPVARRIVLSPHGGKPLPTVTHTMATTDRARVTGERSRVVPAHSFRGMTSGARPGTLSRSAERESDADPTKRGIVPHSLP